MKLGLVTFVALVTTFAAQSTPNAHPIEHPKQVALHFEPSQIRAEVHLITQPGRDSSRHRRDFDQNKDGLLEFTETQRLSARLATLASFAIMGKCNGKPIPWSQFGSPALSDVGEEAGSGRSMHLTMTLVFKCNLTRPPTHFSLTDRLPDSSTPV